MSSPSNEAHAVAFLAGQPFPPLPEWFLSNPTGNGISYDGSSYFSSGDLYMADAGRTHSLTLTFTKAGIFPYVDVADFSWRCKGPSPSHRSVIAAADSNTNSPTWRAR